MINVVKAACVLHNYLRKHSLRQNEEEDNEDMPQDQLLPLESNNSRSTQKAFEIRENFKNYFNSAGAIPWQRESVARGKY